MKTKMDNFLDKILLNLKKINKKEYSGLETTLGKLTGEFLPKKSKSLGSNFFKKIFTANDNIILVLLGHLYIERLLNEIIVVKFNIIDLDNKNSKLNTFYKKIIFLKNQAVIKESLTEDIIIINNLRNCFAHELNYQLSDFNIWTLSELKKYKKQDFEPKYRKTKEIFVRMILKVYLFSIYRTLTKEFRFLHLIDEK